MKIKAPSSFPRYEDFRAEFFRHHGVLPKNNIYHFGDIPAPRRRISLTLVITEALIASALLLYAVGLVR